MKKYLFLVLSFVLGLLLSFLVSYPLMWLWNTCVVAGVLATYPVTWMQMWGIFLFFNIFFKVSKL